MLYTYLHACLVSYVVLHCWKEQHIWDYTLLPQHGRGLCSSGMLCGIGWCWGMCQAVQVGTKTFSNNISNQEPTYAT